MEGLLSTGLPRLVLSDIIRTKGDLFVNYYPTSTRNEDSDDPTNILCKKKATSV